MLSDPCEDKETFLHDVSPQSGFNMETPGLLEGLVTPLEVGVGRAREGKGGHAPGPAQTSN